MSRCGRILSQRGVHQFCGFNFPCAKGLWVKAQFQNFADQIHLELRKSGKSFPFIPEFLSSKFKMNRQPLRARLDSTTVTLVEMEA